MKNLEKQLKALANHRRLAILKMLKHKKRMTVGDIAKEIKLSFKSTSRHLAVLYAAEMVEKEQLSVNVFYRISVHLNQVERRIMDIL